MAKNITTEEKAYAKAQLEIADDLANKEIAEIHEVSRLEMAKTQEERDKLISGAYHLAGKIEGVNFISKLATVSTLMMLKKVKEQKMYRDMPGVGTWENYCNLTGFSRRLIDEQLLNLEKLGGDFLETCFQFGLGYRDLRKLRSISTEGKLTIEDRSIKVEVIEGEYTTVETIPLDDTDELKEALEKLLEAKDAKIAEKDIKIKSMQQVQEFSEKRYADTEKALRQANKKLDDITKTKEIEGVPVEDYPVYKELEKIAETTTGIYSRLKAISADDLSDANRLYLHGTIMHLVNLAGELSFEVPSYGELNTTDADLSAASSLPIPGIRKIAE